MYLAKHFTFVTSVVTKYIMETIRIRGKKDALVKNNNKYKPPKDRINSFISADLHILCSEKVLSYFFFSYVASKKPDILIIL